MKTLTLISVALAVTLLSMGGLTAQEEEKAKPELTPEEVSTGELHITMNSDYAKLQVDGADWEEHAFEDNGRTLIIHRMDRTGDHHVSLTPVYPDLVPAELTIKPADWKLVRLEKRVKMWKATRKITFEKVKKKEPRKK